MLTTLLDQDVFMDFLVQVSAALVKRRQEIVSHASGCNTDLNLISGSHFTHHLCSFVERIIMTSFLLHLFEIFTAHVRLLRIMPFPVTAAAVGHRGCKRGKHREGRRVRNWATNDDMTTETEPISTRSRF